MNPEEQNQFVAALEEAMDDIETADICEQNIDKFAKRICEILQEYGFCECGGGVCLKD